MTNSLLLKMAHLVIDDLPNLKMVISHSYASLQECSSNCEFLFRLKVLVCWRCLDLEPIHSGELNT